MIGSCLQKYPSGHGIDSQPPQTKGSDCSVTIEFGYGELYASWKLFPMLKCIDKGKMIRNRRINTGFFIL